MKGQLFDLIHLAPSVPHSILLNFCLISGLEPLQIQGGFCSWIRLNLTVLIHLSGCCNKVFDKYNL